MWRWTVLLGLLIFYGHTSSQPVTDDRENARQARQLDLGECCPCPGSQGFAAQESSMASDGMFTRARDKDDCPCRPRSSDSEGASSIFFPTSRRSDDYIIRPTDKKEDFKPLLHPEVDLASSVLQTLREATEEEYEEALARDAARTMAKTAGETIFGDAMPEASNGNKVTIIVNPKQSDSFEDTESHVQEARCIHAPLESATPNLGQMRVAQKPPSLLREIFGLSRHNEPAELLHKNLLDMDNGASNIQERVINNDNKVTNKSVLGSRKYAPLIKLDTNMRDKSANLNSKVHIDTSLKKVPDFKLPPLKKLKDLLHNRPTLEDKEKSNSLPLIPTMRFKNPLLKVKGKDIEDLSLSPSNVHEQAKKSFFQTKSHLENILQNTKPVDLKTLLKLKDVEFVPLKDLIPKAAEKPAHPKPKFAWPNIFNKGDISKSSRNDAFDAEVSPSNVIEQINDDNCTNKAFKTTDTVVEDTEGKVVLSDTIDATSNLSVDLIPKATEKPVVKKQKFSWPRIINKGDKVRNPINIARSTEILEKMPKTSKVATLDTEVSPSNVIEQIDDSNCIHTDKVNNVKAGLSDIIDAASSTSEIEEIVNDTSNDITNSQSNELPDSNDNCNMETSPEVENSIPQSTNIAFENEAQTNNEDEPNFETSKEITRGDVIAEQDSESEFVSNAEDCVNDTDDDDSITDSSNNLVDVLNPTDEVLENVDESLVHQSPETQEPYSEELPSDNSNTLNNNPMPLIKPLSLDKTLSTIKENIRKHIDSLKKPKSKAKVLEPSISTHIIGNEDSSPITHDELDSDCQNEDLIQVTTVKPDICNDDLKIDNQPDEDTVSMQDLQKISNEMLQEEQDRETNTVNGCELTQEVTDSNMIIEKSSVENVSMDTDQSANTQDEIIMDPQNIVEISENNNDVKNACKSDLMSPKQPEEDPDANVDASEVVLNRTPQSDDMFRSPLLVNQVRQPSENDFSLNIPLPELPDIKLAPLPTLEEITLPPLPRLDEIKLTPLPTLDEIKLGFTNLFEKPEREVEEHSAFEAASMAETSNVAPIMSTDASVKHFQSLLPPLRLEDVDLDILQLHPQSNLFPKLPKLDLHSFRTKLPLPTDLRIKPLNLQSAFEDNRDLLGASLSLGQNNPWEIPSLDNLGYRMKANTDKISKTLRKPDSLKLKSSHGIGSLESKIRGATTRPVNLQSNDLIEAISRNHEDVNDKLRALHIDFNDRLETMRNNLFDKSIFGSAELSSTKSFSTFTTKDKKSKLKSAQPLSSRRESKKVSKPLRQKETRIGSSQIKFRMPTSASVPVPRTVEVPELKATLMKSPGLGMKRVTGVTPMFQNIEASQPKESRITLWKQANKKLPLANTRLGKTINPFRDSKINISFSTTPRPKLPSKLQSKRLSTPSLTSTLEKNIGRLGQRLDHKGLPSEMRHSISSPPISSNLGEQKLGNYDLKSESRQSALPILKLGERGNLEQRKMSKDLQSWPKASESAFLSKVKEAVKARMSKVNSPVTLKKIDGVASSFIKNGEVLNSNMDMARSASTNIDVIKDPALKENVSYKCTMVCTKE